MDPRFRSGTYKRIKKKIPSGKVVLHFEKRKVNPAVCAVCKNVLPGVLSRRPAELKKLSKSKKTVSRVYGGNMCSKCVRDKIKREYIGK